MQGHSFEVKHIDIERLEKYLIANTRKMNKYDDSHFTYIKLNSLYTISKQSCRALKTKHYEKLCLIRLELFTPRVRKHQWYKNSWTVNSQNININKGNSSRPMINMTRDYFLLFWNLKKKLKKMNISMMFHGNSRVRKKSTKKIIHQTVSFSIISLFLQNVLKSIERRKTFLQIP